MIDDVRPLAAVVERPQASVPEHVVESFQRDGAVLLPGAFTEWVRPLRDGLERILADPSSYAFPCESTHVDEPGRFFDAYCNWQRVPEFLAFVLSSEAASLAAACMRSTHAQLFHEHVFSKESGTAKATPWHHDLPYYCVDGTQTASVYIALDQTPEPTAVRFVRGSHRDGQTYLPRTFKTGDEYRSGDESMISAPDMIDASGPEIIANALEPGDAIVFDFRTLHGTTAAPIEHRRRAFSTRWLGDDVTYVERDGATSPPLTDLGLEPGEAMRADWFPVLWPRDPAA